MVQLVCSAQAYDKLRQELNRNRIEIAEDAEWALVERGYALPEGKRCIVFEPIDYMDVVRLLVSGLQEDVPYRDALTGLSDNKFAVIEPRDVVYLEAGSDGLAAYTKANRYFVKETLQHYEALWSAKGFLRINKSQLANLLRVKEIVPWFNSRYVLRMDNGAELEVSKMYSKKLRHTLNL
ncbi:LytTR family DNA-binding domain-containing protein [Cohnella sp. GCM10027633]|uniref:LytTR family DNA-binding domain-containing protein n=1 Tax=unclassified Cohnella TaxID=2636738 RepID=UPI00364281FF